MSNLAGDAEALTISGSTGAPAWVITETARVVAAPPVGTAATTYNWTTTVRDPGGLTATVPMSITVQNVAPSAVGDTVNVSGGAVSATIVGNDTDSDANAGALRIQQIPATLGFSNGESGTITMSGDQRSITINPLAGLGTSSFTYTVVDGDGGVSAPATVNVIGARFNTAPTAADQTVVAVAGVEVLVELTVNDIDGDPLTVIEVANPFGAVKSVSGTTITIIAPREGTFNYQYRVTDGDLQSGIAKVKIRGRTPATTTTTIVPETTTTTTTTTVPDTTTATTTAAPPTSPPTPPDGG